MPYPIQQLLSDPEQFTKRHPILAPGDQGRVSDMKAKTTTADTFYQVAGTSRVQFFTLDRIINGAFEVDISETRRANSAPLYYLPWVRDQVVRMTLRTSTKAPTEVQGTDGAALEPNFFLTAAVNGCSVFVEGTPDQPTVYHANAAGVGSGSLDDGTAFEIAGRIQEKTMNMRDRFKDFASHHVKAPRGSRPHPDPVLPRETNMNQYLMIPGSELHAEDEKELLAHVAKKHKIRGRKSKVTKFNTNEVIISDFKGTVFGFRSGSTGHWAFYYQKLVEFAHYRKKSFFSKSSNAKNWQFTQNMILVSCEQFWPKGRGNVVFD